MSNTNLCFCEGCEPIGPINKVKKNMKKQKSLLSREGWGLFDKATGEFVQFCSSRSMARRIASRRAVINKVRVVPIYSTSTSKKKNKAIGF